jgi:hypothetical protein
MNEKFEEWWEKHGAYNKFWTSHAAAECAWEAAEKQIAPPNLTSGCNLTPPPQPAPCEDHCQGRECALAAIIGYKCGESPCTKDFANAIKNNSSVGGVHS